MSKFNVGDRIIRVADEYPQYGMYIGKVYTVKEVEEGYQESISVEEIPDKYWLEDYFELHYELVEQQPTQEYPHSIIEELECKIDSLEELISEQAARIQELEADYVQEQAKCYIRLNTLLTSHRSFQESNECRSNELVDTVKLLQFCYDSRYGF